MASHILSSSEPVDAGFFVGLGAGFEPVVGFEPEEPDEPELEEPELEELHVVSVQPAWD